MKTLFAAALAAALLGAMSAQDSFGLLPGEIGQIGSFGISAPGHFSHPQFVAVGEDGSIYVSDLGNKRIQKFASSGEYVAEWGKSGKQQGDFRYPVGVAADGGFVYVADRELNRVQKFTADGEFVMEWGSKGSQDGQLYYPSGVDAHNGTVYVADTGNQRIQIFSSDGQFAGTIGSSGLGPGQFLTITGIDVGPDGSIYVADKGNKKIEKFSPDGTLAKSFAFRAPNYDFVPYAVKVDQEGDMFIANLANSRILHVPQNSSMYLDVFDRNGPYRYSFGTNTDLEIGINGELLAVDSPGHRIRILDTPFYVEPAVPEPVVAPEPEMPDEQVQEHSYDREPPSVHPPASVRVEATGPLTTVNFGSAIATDESGIREILHDAPEQFGPGITTIFWTAFDNLGYSAVANQTVTVTACGKLPSEYNVIEGTEDDDVIYGTDGNDLVFGLSGNDLILSGPGNDCIFGGPGNDIVSGDSGNDTIKGGAGDDILRGQSGNDILYSGNGSDLLDGGEDSDACYSVDSRQDILLSCQ